MVFLGSKRNLPEDTLRSTELWAGCVSGALEKDEYERMLREAGFTEVSVEPTRTHSPGGDRRLRLLWRDGDGGSARERLHQGQEGGGVMLRDRLEERVARLAALGGALSDPIRVRMLGLMARASSGGRGCCDLPEDEEEPTGICVCEFMERYDLAQSKASYHLGKLREAGLVREERRGRWSYYSLRGEITREFVEELGGYLGVDRGEP